MSAKYHPLVPFDWKISDLPKIIRDHSKLVKEAKGETIKVNGENTELVILFFKNQFPKQMAPRQFYDFCFGFEALKMGKCPDKKYKFENSNKYIRTFNGKILLPEVFEYILKNRYSRKPYSSFYNDMFRYVKKDIHLRHNFQQASLKALKNEFLFIEHPLMIPSNFFSKKVHLFLTEDSSFPPNIRYIVKNNLHNKNDFARFFFKKLEKAGIDDKEKNTFFNVVSQLINTINFDERFLVETIKKYNSLEHLYDDNGYSNNHQWTKAIRSLIFCIKDPLDHDSISTVLSSQFFDTFVLTYPFEIDFETHLEENPDLLYNILRLPLRVFDITSYLTFERLETLIDEAEEYNTHEGLIDRALALSTVINKEQMQILKSKFLSSMNYFSMAEERETVHFADRKTPSKKKVLNSITRYE